MAGPRLELPVLQNWSCHNCGGCCRQHLIEVTEAERQRILQQNWTAQEGVHQPVMQWHSGPPWRKRYRLSHTADGGCVFLDEKGLCRIHAKFGEAAKPLPCRVYPFAFHPSGKSFAVSLRFSCPSVVANKGMAVTQRSSELRRMAEEVIPRGAEKSPPPLLTRSDRVDWSDLLPFVEALDHTFADPTSPLVVKLLRAIIWTTLVGQSSFEKLKGPRIRELIGLLMEAARVEFPGNRRAEPIRSALLSDTRRSIREEGHGGGSLNRPLGTLASVSSDPQVHEGGWRCPTASIRFQTGPFRLSGDTVWFIGRPVGRDPDSIFSSQNSGNALLRLGIL